MTDQDSGDEDVGGIPDNLSKRQLLADAEVRTISGEEITPEMRNTQPSNSGNMSSVIPMPTLPPVESHVTYPQYVKEAEWIEGDFESCTQEFILPRVPKHEAASIVDFFELFVDNDLIHLLVEESNRYAQSKNYPDPNITEDEIKCFIGILILSGYNQLPSKRNYWESTSDTHNELVYNSIRRNRFELILRFLHCANNDDFSTTNKDKLWKIRPLIDHMKSRFSKYFSPERNLSYDESMVRCFGRHGLKHSGEASTFRLQGLVFEYS